MSAQPSNSRALKYLRKMRTEDLAEVMRVELAAYPHPWTQKNFEDCLKNTIYSCWVFESDDHIVGHAVISAAVGEAHILNICVAPSEQGKGWGRKLLEEAEWIAKQHQATDCFLEVRSSNTIGKNLYESAGYHVIGLRKNYYPTKTGRENAIIMAKMLF